MTGNNLRPITLEEAWKVQLRDKLFVHRDFLDRFYPEAGEVIGIKVDYLDTLDQPLPDEEVEMKFQLRFPGYVTRIWLNWTEVGIPTN